MSVAKYIDYKVFEFFRDKLLDSVNKYRKAETDTDIYQHMFLAPDEMKEKRSFQLKGVKFPYVCLWATEFPKISPEAYAKSVMFRDMVSPAGEYLGRARITDYIVNYQLFAGGYFKTFVGEIDQDITEIDMTRGYDMVMDELLTGYVSKFMITKKGSVQKVSVDEKQSERQFTLSASLDIEITIPLLSKEMLLDGLTIYLNDKEIYEWSIPI